jgi:hypothetical protein
MKAVSLKAPSPATGLTIYGLRPTAKKERVILLYWMIGKAYRSDTGITMIIQVVVSGKAVKWKFLPQQNKQSNIDKYKNQN